MEMIQLNDLLPPKEWEMNWTFYGEDHDGFPQDAEYVVFEYYCKNPSCDCKSIRIDVMRLGDDGEPIPKSLAVLHYDWSSEETQCSPTLGEESPKTAETSHILEVYKKFIHSDEYLLRIKRQYSHVKKLVNEDEVRKIKQKIALNVKELASLKGIEHLGRNDPCPCASGRKYKKCCLMTISSQYA